jgi:hypothetical protein
VKEFVFLKCKLKNVACWNIALFTSSDTLCAIVVCTCPLYTLLLNSFSTKPYDIFMDIVFCMIYWFKQLHHFILSQSHAYLKSDLSKTFEFDLNAHPRVRFFFLQEEPVRNLLVYCSWIASIPTEPLKRPLGPTICTASDWDFEGCCKIYMLFLIKNCMTIAEVLVQVKFPRRQQETLSRTPMP